MLAAIAEKVTMDHSLRVVMVLLHVIIGLEDLNLSTKNPRLDGVRSRQVTGHAASATCS